MLLSLEFAQSFGIQFRASQYITGLNRTFEKKVIVVLICSQLQHSISNVSIYYVAQSNFRVKSYCRLNFIRASVNNFERLDILRDTIGHSSKKLLSFEFYQSFGNQFRTSRYITWLNRTSE